MPIAVSTSGVRACWSQLRNELRLLCYAPTTYVFQTGFLLSLSACIFFVADFYASDLVGLHLLLLFLPWVAMVLVPALAMRAWGDPYIDRGHELTLSLPLGLCNIVLGKYLAGCCLLWLSLLFTAPFALSSYYLGEVDSGAMVAGYLAAALLMALYYAVALLCALLAREPVSAFVAGLGALLLLMALGWDSLQQAAHNHLPSALLELLIELGPKSHYDAIASGYIQLSDLLYFALTIALLLYVSVQVLQAWRSARIHATKLAGMLLVVAIGMALIGAFISAKPVYRLAIDITEQGEYSLSDTLVKRLATLDTEIDVVLYWSRHQSSVPAAIKAHARRVQRLLDRLRDVSRQRLSWRLVDPVADTDAEIDALQSAMQRIPMSSGDHFFLGASLAVGERRHPLGYLDSRRGYLLEYDIAAAIDRLLRAKTPALGIVSPLLAPTAIATGRPGLAVLAELKQRYDVSIIPYFATELPPDLDVLLVMQTPVLAKSMLYAIDQFVMRGGGLAVLIDPYVRFDDSLNAFDIQPSSQIDDISDLLAAYGIHYRGARIVGDQQLASTVTGSDQFTFSYPYWMRLQAPQLARDYAASAAINELFLVDAGEFTLSGDAQPLLFTTTSAGTIARKDYIARDAQALALEFAADGGSKVLGAVINRPVHSAFAATSANTASYVATTEANAAIVAIADVDWIFDPFSLHTEQVDGQALNRPLNDNSHFLQQLLAHVSGGDLLASIRVGGRAERSFTRVAALFKASEQAYQAELATLSERVQTLQSYLDEALAVAGVERLEQLPQSMQRQARALRDELLAAQRGLREIRRQIRADIDRLGSRLTLLNLLAPPALVLVFAALVRWRRWRLRYRATSMM